MWLCAGGMTTDRISLWKIDAKDGRALPATQATGLQSPSFLCAHPHLPLIYVAERRWSAEDSTAGAISTFAFDPSEGKLRQIARCRSGGAFTAHVSVSGDGTFLAASNPRGPTLALFALRSDGLPAGEPGVVTHRGRGATTRQQNPWPHSAFFTPCGRQVLACDMGLDRVFVYDVDRQACRLVQSEQSFVQVSSGAGARHLAITPDGSMVCVVNEIDSTVSYFDRDPATGRMHIRQTLSTCPEGYLGDNLPAEILIRAGGSPDQPQHVLVTNRGADSITVFSREAVDGRLSVAGIIPALGLSPRHVSLSKDGRIMALCNQASGNVALFRLDNRMQAVPLREYLEAPDPTCAIFLEFEKSGWSEPTLRRS